MIKFEIGKQYTQILNNGFIVKITIIGRTKKFVIFQENITKEIKKLKIRCYTEYETICGGRGEYFTSDNVIM